MAGDFDLSARITADASGLVDAAAQGSAAIDRVGASVTSAAAPAAALADATQRTTEASAQAATSANRLREVTDAAAEAAYQAALKRREEAAATVAAALAAAQAERAETAAAAAARTFAVSENALAEAHARTAAETAASATATRSAATAFKGASDAANDNAKGTGNARIAQLELGHVIRASADAYAAGAPPAQIFAQEIGRISQVAQYAGGSLGAIGAFLGGPWGILVTLGVSVLGPFVAKLLEGSDAAQAQADALAKASAAADSYGTAQGLLGKVIELTTGKLKTQNETLIQTIKLQAQANILAGQKAQRDAIVGAQGITDVTVGEQLKGASRLVTDGPSGFILGALQDGAKLGPLKQAISEYISLTNIAGASDQALGRGLDATLRKIDNLAASGRLAGRDAIAAKQAVLALGTSVNDQRANQLVVDAIDGKGVDPRLVPFKATPKPKAPPKPKKAPDTDGLVNSVENDIQSITAAFTEAPTFIEKARVATAKLDTDIEKLSKKKPPNFQTLIDQARQAQQVIRDNLDKPYRDFVTTQNDALDVLKLQVAGQTDQAAALKEVQALQKTMGPLTQEQRDGVLATVQAIRAEQRELEIRNELNQKYLTAIASVKSAVLDATQAFVRGDLGQFLKTPGKLLDAFQTLEGQKIFDRLFSGVFRDLQDQVNGTSVAKDAAEKYAAVVDNVSAETERARAAFASIKNPLGEAASGVQAFTTALSGATAALGGSSSATSGVSLADQLAQGNNVNGTLRIPGAANDNGQKDIVVTARQDPIVKAISGVATGIAGLFTNPSNAERLGASIGKFAGKGLEGAATGTLVAGIGKSLGINLSSGGSSLGGAVGGILGSIKGVTSALGPFGAALTPVLSVVGGLIGKLFAPKAQPGGVTISSVNGSAAIAGNVGSDAAGIQAGNSLGANVVSGINSIAQQLGGTIGAFNVEIGKYKDDLRVNVNGRPLGGVTGSGAVGFGTDESAAVSYAISQAIAQGAVSGLDAAVQKALASSTDTQKALTEALGVKNLEIALGGVQASLKQTFDTERTTAANRLRLAQTYGLDVLATEKYNDDQRAALVTSTLKTAVGSLQDFLTSLTSGDLFEGSAADKRTALKAQIAAVQVDAGNGVDGAADKLAQLEQQLLTTTRDAFGTAGDEYATDRSDAMTAVQSVIQMETDRVNVAAGLTQATTDAVVANTAATNESNDLLAQVVTGLGSVNSTLIAKLDLSNIAGGSDGFSTLRNSNLAVA